MKIAAVMLDALGTLVELAPPAPRLRQELETRFGVTVSQAQAQRAIAAEIAYYRTHLQIGSDAAGVALLRARCAGVLRCALPPSAALAQVGGTELTEALLSSLRFSVFADVHPALKALRDRGARLIVVSNWDVSLHVVLAALGLTTLVDGIVTSAEAGVPKPSPAIFEQALRLARIPAERAIHVGDSVEEDVAGALAAGIVPVLLRRDGAPGPPGVATIRSLSDLEGHRF